MYGRVLVAARLVLPPPGQNERTIELTGGCSIGTTEDDVTVPTLPRRALVVTPMQEGIIVEPGCPITVAGRAIPPGSRRLLRMGERVEVRGCTLWLARGSTPEQEGTRALAGAFLTGAAALPVAGPSVLAVQGPAAGRRFAIGAGAVIGRGPGADVALGDPLASRRHCRLEARDGAILARDLGSKNGLSVNGRTMGRRGVALATGDELLVGASVLVYEDGRPSPCPSPSTPGAETPAEERRPGAPARIAIVVLASATLLALAGLLALAAG